MKSITKILKGTLAVILLICVTSCGKNQAKINFEEAVTSLEAKNQELDSAVTDLKILLESEDKLLDMALPEQSAALIKNADAVKVLPPEMGKGDEVIAGQVSELNAVDYSTVITELKEMAENMQTSIQQRKLVTNPPEEQVMYRILTIENITAAEAVTEGSDPNGMLNKPGGYTSAIFFECDLVPATTQFKGTSALEKGTPGGGCLEVYASPEDAESRNAYLSTFDGRIFAAGKHAVIGTVVIRVSGEMKEQDQELMIQRLIEALTAPE
ncbi:MAG: hypothetical protein IJJ44_06115 [Solobacterium sp.]|nr:hypothetical protein [Solobacterium sp.]